MNGLERIPLLEALPPDMLDAFAARCRRARYDAHELVLDYDDDTSDVYFILSGGVRVLYRTATGKEMILCECGPGSLFGEIAALDGEPRSANVTALCRSEMCVMSGPVFLELVERAPEVSRALLRLFAERLRGLNGRLAEYNFLQARHRLYAELLRLSRPRTANSGERIVSPAPFQHDLANRIGARREVVSRELAALAKSGLVAKPRGGLVLLDPAELSRRISAALEE